MITQILDEDVVQPHARAEESLLLLALHATTRTHTTGARPPLSNDDESAGREVVDVPSSPLFSFVQTNTHTRDPTAATSSQKR